MARAGNDAETGADGGSGFFRLDGRALRNPARIATGLATEDAYRREKYRYFNNAILLTGPGASEKKAAC
jgi:hypothetical protein